MNRRSFLAVSGIALAGTSGCLSLQGPGRQNTDNEGSASSGTPPLSDENDSYGDGFEARGAWPVNGFDAGRQGRNPATTAPRGNVGAAWLRTPVEGQRTFRTTPPVTDDSHVYVGSGAGADEGDNEHDGFVAAFDGETGDRGWRTRVTAGSTEAVVYADERLLAVSTVPEPSQTTLSALAPTDGREQWHVDLPSYPSGGPVVTNGRAYVTSDEGGLMAVSLDGAHQWTESVSGSDDGVATAPCATASTVFVGTDNGHVVAVAADDGEQQWDTKIVADGHRPRIQTTPTVAGETIFVTGTDYRLYAVNATDGTIRWNRSLLDERYGNAIPSVAVGDETVYVNTIHGGLIALHQDNGSERWRTGDGGIHPPAATDELIIAPNGETVQAYTPDGKQQWRFEMPAFDAGMAAYIMNPRVALAHNRAYISLNDGRVFSLGAK